MPSKAFKSIALSVVFYLAGYLCSAQVFTLTGKVTLQEDPSQNLANVTVFLPSANKISTTDSVGRYNLMLPAGTYKLQAYLEGYALALKMVKIEGNITVDISLSLLKEELSQVSITQQKKVTNGISRLKPLEGLAIYEAKKNEVIQLADFATNQVNNNARQIFAKVPGLNIWESDFAGLQLDIAARGLGPSRTANFNTRQNGYDMSADALGYPESYYLPSLQAVERIEIVRGAASLQYGTQFGGMLNFKIKEAPNKPVELNLVQGLGSFGLSNTFVSLGGRHKKVDYYSYYQFRRGDGWRENSGFYAHNAFTRLGWQVNRRLKIGAEYSFQHYQAQQPGGLTDGLFEEGKLTQSLRARNWFKVNWNLFAATANYRFSPQTQLSFKAFGLLSQRDALGNLSQIGVVDNPRQNRTLIQDQFKNLGAEARLLHRYKIKGKRAALATGARYYRGLTQRAQGDASATAQPEFKFLNPDNPEAFDYDFPSRNYALFAENLLNITPRLRLTTGVRLEHIRTEAQGIWNLNRFDFAGNLVSSLQNNDTSAEVRTFPLFGVGLSYYLNENLSLYSNFSQNFRSITFSDLRVVNPNFRLDSLITDERGYNLDLGLRGQLSPWLSLDVSLFLMRYNQRIGLYALPGSTTLFRTNIGDSRHLGLESFIELGLLKLLGNNTKKTSLSVFLNLALTEATYVASAITAIQGRQVEYVPSAMLRTGANFRYAGFKATYQYSYLGKQFSDATNATFNPNALSGIIPSYAVMDFSVAYQFKRYSATAGVNNLTNQQYFTRRAEAYPGPGIIPATIRNFYVSVGLSL